MNTAVTLPAERKKELLKQLVYSVPGLLLVIWLIAYGLECAELPDTRLCDSSMAWYMPLILIVYAYLEILIFRFVAPKRAAAADDDGSVVEARGRSGSVARSDAVVKPLRALDEGFRWLLTDADQEGAIGSEDNKDAEDDREDAATGRMSARQSLMNPLGAIREAMNWIASDAIPEEGAGDDEDGHASKSGDQASARMSGRNSLMDPVGAIRESMNWLASDAIPEEGEEGGAPYGSGDNDSDEEDEDEDGDVVRESMMETPVRCCIRSKQCGTQWDGWLPVQLKKRIPRKKRRTRSERKTIRTGAKA